MKTQPFSSFLLHQYIAWQQETMLHAALANAQMCASDNGDPTDAVDVDDITEHAKVIRAKVCECGSPATPDEMARCTDATIRWCAEQFGYLKAA